MVSAYVNYMTSSLEQPHICLQKACRHTHTIDGVAVNYLLKKGTPEASPLLPNPTAWFVREWFPVSPKRLPLSSGTLSGSIVLYNGL